MESARARLAWNVVIAIAVLAVLSAVRVALGDKGLLVDIVAAALAAWGAWEASRLARVARSQRAWRFQLIFPLTWAMGAFVLLVGGSPLIADVLRAVALLSVAAAWWLTSRAVDSWSRVRLVVDGCLAAATVFVAGWAPAFEPAWARAGGGADGAFSVGIPLATASAAMFVMGLGITEMQGRHRLMPMLYVASLGVIGVSDVLWAVGNTPLWALGWGLAFFATRAYQGTSERLQVVSTRLALTHAPYLLILPATATFAASWVRGRSLGPEIAAGVFMVLLLLVRQHVTLLENRRLVHRLAETESLLRHRATHDDLTGLAGRVLLVQRLHEVALKGRDGTWPVALVFIDLDGFKGVNDAHGHAGGDHLLVTLAQRLEKVTRPMGSSALAVRISGDEFAVLLVKDQALAAEHTARVILDELSRPVQINGSTARVGASIGVASTTADRLDPSGLLGAADDAMYVVKRGVKGGIAFAAGEVVEFPANYSDADYRGDHTTDEERTMDLGDMMDKAKDAAKDVSDEQIDQARDFVDDKVDDKFDGALDAAEKQAKKLND